MRLWSIHPRYLDRQGLLAVWREALLAQAVLLERTRGYRRHPQLDRFKAQRDPAAAVGAYLAAVQAEATVRGYAFCADKIVRRSARLHIALNEGQLAYEWAHFLAKTSVRSPHVYAQWRHVKTPECHPLFVVRPGGVEPWEKIPVKKLTAMKVARRAR
jgi:hypothetical protein